MSFQDLPIEILRTIFKNLDPRSVKNCSITCNRWKEVVAHYIFQPYLQRLAKDENLKLSLRQKLKKNGWTPDCVDYNLIITLYEYFLLYHINFNLKKRIIEKNIKI